MKRVPLHDIEELKYKIGVVNIKLEYITNSECGIMMGRCAELS